MGEEAIKFYELSKSLVDLRRYKAGQMIFSKGDVGFEMLVIKEGVVELSLDELPLRRLTIGDAFGEMALVDDSIRSATAIAVTDVVLAPVSEKQFVQLIRETPRFALDVMRLLAQRLRGATQKN